MEAADTQQLETMLALYTGDLLEGVYDDWALRERERLRHLYLDGLEHLMLVHKHQQAYKQSVACGQQILEYDPLRESIHRELIRIYWAAGQPTMAVRQYQACKAILSEELNIAPMPETQALHAQIISETGHHQPTLHLPDHQAALQQAMHQLQLAFEENQRTQEKLKQAMALLQHYVKQQSSQP
jgi:DNA-binding SARP family transcriptional activator